MVPWTLEYLMKVLLGMGSSDESRLHNLLQQSPKGSPTFKTNQKLFDPNNLPRHSSYAPHGLGFVHEFMSDQRFNDLPDFLRLSEVIELFFNLTTEYKTHEILAPGARLVSDLLRSFPRLISAAVFLESIIPRLTIEQSFIKFSARRRSGEPKRTDGQDSLKDIQLDIELHAFLLYMAAAELDIADLDGSKLMGPAHFVPSSRKKTIRYPMETFWDWFRLRAGIAQWTGFSDALGTTTALLSKYRKAKSLDPSPSYKQLRKFCQNLWPLRGLGRRSQKTLEIFMAYGVARIMQEHAHRCLPLILGHYCDEAEIEGFYLHRIKEYRQWVQEIPLHPLFSTE